MNADASAELASHEEEEGEIEEEEEGHQGDVNPEGSQAEWGSNAIRCCSKNRTRCLGDTHKKMKVMMNQAAKKIPMALVSSAV